MIGEYMVDSITIQPRGTADKFGSFPYNIATTVTTARVQRKRGTVLREQGRIVEYTHVVWVRPTETIALEDRIIYASTNYTVLAIEERDFVDGADNHKRLLCA